MKSSVFLTLFSLALCQSRLPQEPISLSATQARAYIITGERSDDGSARAAPQELYTIDQDSSNEGIAECKELDNDSCTKIEVDFEVLRAELDIILEGEVFRHSYTSQNPDDDFTTYAYNTDDFGSALFMYTETEGYPLLDGYILFDGQEYTVNNCGSQCGNGHILVKLTEGKYDEQMMMMEAERGVSLTNASVRIADRSLAEDRWASDGRTGISMMAYYTPEFEQEFGGRSEAEREIKKYIEETNKAYKDSGINVQLHAFCFEKMDISDNENDVANKRLDDFTWKKGSIHKLLNSFDIAILLTKNGAGKKCWNSACTAYSETAGVAWTGSSAKDGYSPPSTPNTWIKAGSPLTFAHEVSHILGALHNREEHSGGENQQHRYGYLMKGSNKLTIMAYKRDSYTQKIARFSADTTVNGIRLGNSQNNNVDQIRKAAPILAEIGDESCSDKCGSCETCGNEKEPDNNYCSVPSNVNCCASHGCGMGDYFQKYCKELCGLCDKGNGGDSGDGNGGGDSGTGGSCENGADPNGWCNDDNKWACTNDDYKEYFTTHCKKTCGLCGSGGDSGGDPPPFPVNCEWGAWEWGTCSVTCGGGTQTGSRTKSQQAANGGTECTGGDTTTRSCNTDSCPGGSGTGGSCIDGADPNNWCHDVNSWACTNPTYQQYFTTNCKTLCGLCSGGGSSNCQDKNEWGYCQARFQYACTDNRYKDWFVPDCEKLCGQC